MSCRSDDREPPCRAGRYTYFILSLPIFLGLLAGCTSVRELFKTTPIGPKFQYERAENPQDVTIYLYRPWRSGSSIPAPLITINGEEILNLRNGGYTRIHTSLGQYILETHHSDNWAIGTEDHIVLDIKQYETYFIRVLPSTGLGRTDFEISIFDEQTALKEISDTEYLDPTKQQYQYDRNYTIVCKVGDIPSECKHETRNLQDRSGPGRFILDLTNAVSTGINSNK